MWFSVRIRWIWVPSCSSQRTESPSTSAAGHLLEAEQPPELDRAIGLLRRDLDGDVVEHHWKIYPGAGVTKRLGCLPDEGPSAVAQNRRMRGRSRGLGSAVAAAVAILLVVPAAASALRHYAAPTNRGTHDCLSPQNACTLPSALTGAPDEVVLATGNYGSDGSPLASFSVASPIDIHGPATGPLPRIFITGFGIQLQTGGAKLRRVEVVGGNGDFFTVNLGAGTVDQAFLHTAKSGSAACAGTGGAMLNTVCHTDGAGVSAGLYSAASVGADTAMTFRNDTLIGTGGYRGAIISISGGHTSTFDFSNVIVRGSPTDIEADAIGAGTVVKLNLDHSNYATKTDSGSTTTPAGTGTNQTAAPLLTTDFRELAGSPTVDAGVTSALSGPFDLAGAPRVQGGGTDIGAYEFPFTPTSPTSMTAPIPSNAFSFGKLKRNRKKGIAFLFVNLPGAGDLRLGGKGLSTIDRAVSGGTVKLKVAPGKKGKKTRKLRRTLLGKGKAKVKAFVTYLPTGGVGDTKVLKIKLIRRG